MRAEFSTRNVHTVLLCTRDFGELRRRKGSLFSYGDERNYIHVYRDTILHLESTESLGNVSVLR